MSLEGSDVRSQIWFRNKQHQFSLRIENLIQFGPGTTEKSSSEIGAKSVLILTKFWPNKMVFLNH